MDAVRDVRADHPRTSGGTGSAAPAASLPDVMRLLGGLALVAPFAAIVAWLTMPSAMSSWVDDGIGSIVAAAIAALVGVSMS